MFVCFEPPSPPQLTSRSFPELVTCKIMVIREKLNSDDNKIIYVRLPFLRFFILSPALLPHSQALCVKDRVRFQLTSKEFWSAGMKFQIYSNFLHLCIYTTFRTQKKLISTFTKRRFPFTSTSRFATQMMLHLPISNEMLRPDVSVLSMSYHVVLQFFLLKEMCGL